LISEIEHQTNVFKAHYLAMPNPLRRSGGFGTHWMLQPRITVMVPRQDPGRGTALLTLDGSEVVELVRALFSGPASKFTTKRREVFVSVYADFSRKWTALQTELASARRASSAP